MRIPKGSNLSTGFMFRPLRFLSFVNKLMFVLTNYLLVLLKSFFAGVKTVMASVIRAYSSVTQIFLILEILGYWIYFLLTTLDFVICHADISKDCGSKRCLFPVCSCSLYTQKQLKIKILILNNLM